MVFRIWPETEWYSIIEAYSMNMSHSQNEHGSESDRKMNAIQFLNQLQPLQSGKTNEYRLLNKPFAEPYSLNK